LSEFVKRKYAYTSGGILGGLVFEEVVGKEGDVKYCVYRDGNISVEAYLDVGLISYYPFYPCPWKAPRNAEPYESEDELFREVRDFTYEHLDISADNRFYIVLASWMLASWVQEKFNTAPYVHFHGPPNSGKSRGLEVLQALGFRPLLSPSVSPASIFRAMQLLKPTFLLDEAELYETEAKREVLSVLNAGYRRGQYVFRIQKETTSLQAFDVFGFKALAGVSDLPLTLAGRAIHVPMMRMTRKVRRRIDEEWAQSLRNKLLMYRFRHILEKPELGVNPLNVPDGRLIELMTPLILVAPNQNVEAELISFGEDVFKSLIEEERTTDEAQVFSALLTYIEAQHDVELVAIQAIADILNEGRTKKEQFSNLKVGKLMKRLGFEKRRIPRDGRVGVVVNNSLIQRLKIRYLMEEEKRELALADEVQLVLKAIDELKDDKEVVSKVAVQDRLKGQIDRTDTLKIIDLLVHDGKLVEVDAENVRRLT
jgi:hypothetical protein